MNAAEAGLLFARSEDQGSRFVVGYRYEQWFGVGDLGPSRLDLQLHNLFLRWEHRY